MPVRALAALRSPAGPRARLSILIFHRVLAQPDALFPDEVDAARFDRLCSWVRQWFEVLPLDDAARRLALGTLPARALAITFDDGYEDNCSIAMPILQRHGLSATFFVATGFLDGGCMWNDRIIEAIRGTGRTALDLAQIGYPEFGAFRTDDTASRRAAIDAILPRAKYFEPAQRLALSQRVTELAQSAPPEHLMMSSQQVRDLHAGGMQIGAHTVNHPILARLDAAAAAREIGDSKRQLETLTRAPVTLFAYPNGRRGDDYDDASVALVREAGFEAAVATTWGAARRDSDRFQLPRFTPWDRSRLRFGLRLVDNLRR
ncbi:MAG TPA: polysaccharide deacetylase family protein [Rubrivivax sp.]|nr:polysaccharide deacetylase family protein [Rubrivivax sp.]